MACVLRCNSRRTSQRLKPWRKVIARARIPIRGIRHYDAKAAAKADRLNPGQPLRLIPRPDNPYDNTAVEIRLEDGTMLGHVPRERSAEFFALLGAGRITSSRIYSIQGNAPYIEIDVEFMASGSEGSPDKNSAISQNQGRGVGAAPPPRSIPNPQPEQASSRWIWWLIGLGIIFYIIAQ
jgi:hypothetical protein